ncbi:MAG: NADAR family protein [Candidatus Woesearchaeota archaeon]
MIDEFKGEYRFLSNFYPAPFTDEKGVTWPTSEHYYQAMKTKDENIREYIRKLEKPGDAKKYARKIELRDDWEDVKLQVMGNAIVMKFLQNPKILEKLINTYPKKLVEGNFWHDNIWGDCKCDKCKNIKGYNYLGRMLMQVRIGIINKDF